MQIRTAIGRDSYIYFLRKVALLPYTPEELLRMGQQEWERAVSFETYEANRNKDLPQSPIFPNVQMQIAKSNEDELRIRKFLNDHEILTVPEFHAIACTAS